MDGAFETVHCGGSRAGTRVRQMAPQEPIEWRAGARDPSALLGDHEVARHALAEAERTGDPIALGYALHGQSVAYLFGDPDEQAGLACIERALTVIGERPETADLRGL